MQDHFPGEGQTKATDLEGLLEPLEHLIKQLRSGEWIMTAGAIEGQVVTIEDVPVGMEEWQGKSTGQAAVQILVSYSVPEEEKEFKKFKIRCDLIEGISDN